MILQRYTSFFRRLIVNAVSAMRNLLWTLVFLATGSMGLAEEKPAAKIAEGNPPNEKEALAFFEAKIRPVLVEHCYECHSAGSKLLKGGLHLDARRNPQGRGHRSRGRAGKFGEEPDSEGAGIHRRKLQNAAEREAAGRCNQGFSPLDRQWCPRLA